MSVLSLSALSFAQGELWAGVAGGKPGWGRFRGPSIDAYMAAVGLHNPDDPTAEGSPWCAAFVYAMFERAVEADPTGIAINPCPRTAGALHLYEKAQLKCRQSLPFPSAVFVLSKGGGKGHVGFVESVSPDGRQVTTVEGDTSPDGSRVGDSVGRHTWDPMGNSRGVLLGWLDL